MDTTVEEKLVSINFQSDSDGQSAHLSLNRKRPFSVKKAENRITEESYNKRPRLIVDTSDCQPLCEALSSNESFSSSCIDNEFCRSNSSTDLVPPHQIAAATTGLNSTGLGLSAYLEDIVSDEELDEIEATPPTNAESGHHLHGKDELLTMMDKVDRDITLIEQMIQSLEKKQNELFENAKVPTVDSSNQLPSVSAVATSRSDESGSGSQKSLMEQIYSENKRNIRYSHVHASGSNSLSLSSNSPMYYQPSEAPSYWLNIQRHKHFRPELLKYLKVKKIGLYKKECTLVQKYDHLLDEWERKVDKWEKSQKKRVKDVRNREMFEKVFPELKSKSEQLRDQASRFSRVGMRAFGVVKSEAELDELAYELFEQEEARGRHRITHASVPSMVLGEKEKQLQFVNTNGLMKDPMVVYRETKSISLWTEKEKILFREKFQLFPKNFEKIASFLPNKSISDCVRYYYLAKKNGKFKSLSRRSAFKRRRQHLPKSQDYSTLFLDQPKTKPHPQSSMPINVTSKEQNQPQPQPPVVWSREEIERLKEGLRNYGRAWGRVYREVGGYKTATQCKQFYDDYCTDSVLDLNSALAEHSARKNAERAEKKIAEMQKMSIVEPSSETNVDNEERASDSGTSESETSEHMSSQEDEQESDSETTITDSGQEEEEEEEEGDAVMETQKEKRSSTSRPKLNPLNLGNGSRDSEPVQSPLDIFLSAAEALSNTVPSEIALHDHTYSYPPLDIQGGSGLQLIAAAAAVVSPGLSKTTWNNSSSSSTNKTPLSHTVKAPRGRPPSTQKRSASTSQRIGPSFLTPTSGASQNVPLQEIKSTLRGRSRSAPTEKGPRPQMSQKNSTIASPLLLKGGTKLFTTSQTVKGGNNSPLSYTSRSKDGNIVSLKPSGGAVNPLDALVSVAVDSQKHLSSSTQNAITRPSATVTTRTKDNTNNNNPVLELNLALLLAASGTNQQATLLLPPSSLFNNKHTLAVLHSGTLGDGSSLSVDTPTSFTIAKHTPTISIDLSRSSVDSTINNNPIPIVTPLKSQANRQTLTLSLASAANPKVKPSNTVSIAPPTSVVLPISSVQKKTTPSSSSAPVTPVTMPTTDDLSNLNLLSNLVAGMSSKNAPATPKPPPPPPPSSSSSSCVSNSNIRDSAPANKPATVISSNSSTVSQVPSQIAWKKQIEPTRRSKSPVTSTTYNSAQQSLMLYTRSLPLKDSVSPEEEDHLEYATRGIDELTRLLGGSDSNKNTSPITQQQSTSANNGGSKGQQRPLWSPDELLCNPFNNSGVSGATQANIGAGKCAVSSTSLLTVVASEAGFVQHPTSVLTELKAHSTS